MKRGIITIGLLILTALASPFLAIGGIKLMTMGQIYENIEDVPQKDMALVLGAAAFPNGLSDVLEDRVKTAIELYENDKVDQLVMSGGDNEAPAMKDYAEENGVPAEDIIEDPNGLNTLASVKNLPDKEKSIIIVTQEYHLPRSLFIAGTMDIDAIGMVADKQEYLNIEKYKKREFWATGKAILDVILGN